MAALGEKRQELVAKGVSVSDVVDRDWANSMYFKDPNGTQLGYCCLTCEFNDREFGCGIVSRCRSTR
jgi:hypothetical protein